MTHITFYEYMIYLSTAIE